MTIKTVLFRTGLTLSVLLLLLFFAASNFLATFRLDDDNLYYLISGLTAPLHEQFRSTFQTLISCVSVDNAGDIKSSFPSRLDLRYNYISNYTGLSALWGLFFSTQIEPKTDAVLDAGRFMSTFLWPQLVILTLATFAVSIGVGGSRRMAALAVSVLICCTLAIIYYKADRMTVGSPSLSLKFVLSAPSNFNIFHFAPRGVSAFVLLVACLWRWHGSFRIFYFGILLLCFIHQSNATLVILTFVGMDAIVRPEIFRDKISSCFAVASVACIFSREELTNIVGLPIFATLFIALSVIGFAATKTKILERLLAAIRDRFGISPAVEIIDVFLIVAVWLGSMPILRAAVSHGFVDQFSGRYVFWQLHTRYGSLFLATVIAGVAFNIFKNIERNIVPKFVLAGLLIPLAAFGVWAQPNLSIPTRRHVLTKDIQTGIASLDQAARLFWSEPSPNFGRDEEMIFYYSQLATIIGRPIIAAPIVACHGQK